MFLAMVALSALILSLVVRRPVRALLDRKFHYLELLWLGAMLHLAYLPAGFQSILARPLSPGLPQTGGLLYVASLLLLLAFIWTNRRHLGVAAIGMGLLMNTSVIAANGGHMPVDPACLAMKGALEETIAAERSGEWTFYVVAHERTRLVQIDDRIMMPRPILDPVILSPGDLVIAFGIVLFFMVIPEASARAVLSRAPAV